MKNVNIKNSTNKSNPKCLLIYDELIYDVLFTQIKIVDYDYVKSGEWESNIRYVGDASLYFITNENEIRNLLMNNGVGRIKIESLIVELKNKNLL